jgi:hypothetical protein
MILLSNQTLSLVRPPEDVAYAPFQSVGRLMRIPADQIVHRRSILVETIPRTKR